MAMSEREIAYIISARDEASEMFKRLNAAAEKSGMSIKEVMDEASKALDKTGNATNKLTNFIKEQRSENRQQNFLLRESVGAFGAVATALTIFSNTAGAGSQQVKVLTDSVNAGVGAFQGFNFALGALGISGPIGMAIAAIGAIAIAIQTMKARSQENNSELRNSELALSKVRYELGELGKAELEEAYASVRAGLMKRLMELKTETADVWGTIWKHIKILGTGIIGLKTLIEQGPDALIQKKLTGSQKEIVDAAKGIADLDLELKKLWDTWMKEIPKDRGPIAMADLLQGKIAEASETWKKHIGKMEGETIGMSDVMKEILKGIEKDFTDKAALVTQIWGQVSSALGDAFTAAFTGTEGGARVFLKRILTMVIDMVQGIILAAAAAAIVKGIFTFGTTLAGDLAILAMATVALQAARAAINSKFHQGGTVPGGMFLNASPAQEFPILVRGGETVRTEQQEAAVQRSSGGVHFHFHNSNFASPRAFKEVVQRGMRELGIRDVGSYFRDNSHEIRVVTP